MSLVDFEELNSDYINEHFGELQDEAYKKGLQDETNGNISIRVDWMQRYKRNPQERVYE